MRIEISAIEQSTADTKGNLAAVGLLTRQSDRHLLLMEIATAAKLIEHLCSAGLVALQAQGGDESRVETFDASLVPDAVAAGIRPTGEVDLVLRFGRLTLAARLDAEKARSLGAELCRAGIEGPSTRQ